MIRINGVDYEYRSINVELKGIEYDEFESKVKYIKSCGIKLFYGASSNFPISAEFPSEEHDKKMLKILGIDYKSIPRDKWFKY